LNQAHNIEIESTKKTETNNPLMSNSSISSSWSRRFDAVTYDDSADEFVRFHDDPNDDRVKSVVTAATALSDSEREEFRTDLSDAATETVRLYALRRTLQAKRRASINLVDEAIQGFALLPNLNDVAWDSWLKAVLFIADSLGRDVNALAEIFADIAAPAATSRFEIAFESMSRVESLADCRIADVTTTYGTGFVETLVFRDPSSAGLSSGYTARRPDEFLTFRPKSNVAQLAVSTADRLDTTNTVITSHLYQDQLAAMLFDVTIPGSFLPTTGCLSFFADSRDGGASFKVFAAELEEEFDVGELTTANSMDGPAVFIDDHRLILMLANPSFDDADEEEFDRTVFANIAESALRESAPTRWTAR
jgi:hypothetical protein